MRFGGERSGLLGGLQPLIVISQVGIHEVEDLIRVQQTDHFELPNRFAQPRWVEVVSESVLLFVPSYDSFVHAGDPLGKHFLGGGKGLAFAHSRHDVVVDECGLRGFALVAP